MKHFKLKSLVIAATVAMTGSAIAENNHSGPFGFTPINESASSADWNPARPWKLPEGFSQTVVSDESDLNIYDAGRNDWHDMNSVNETGKYAGRYLYRTHEVRGLPEGGAVTVVDLKTGATKILAQDTSWTALDGIRWTPWGSFLFAEETAGGRLFEAVLDKKDMMSAKAIIDHPAVGRLAHEGIEIGNDGAVYVVDEWRGQTSGCGDRKPCGGGIYKFEPDNYGDLSSGNLFVLQVMGEDGTGQAEWVGPIDPLNARESGTDFGGTSYQRPEDLEMIGNTLYVAVTEGSRDDFNEQKYDGRVIALNLNTMMVSDFVKPGVNVAIEVGKPGEAGFQTGLDNPDNLAQTPDGKLIIVEDNKPSDIWIASKDHDNDGAADNVWLFASLTDPGAEGTGIYFGKDPKTMFVNIQHSAAEDGDGTWAISKKK